MDAFSLLNYWRGGGGGGTAGAASGPNSYCASKDIRAPATTTMITTASPRSSPSSSSSSSSDNDDGPFFDLEFSLPDENDTVEDTTTKHENGCGVTEDDESGESEDDEAGGINVALSSSSSYGSSNELIDSNISLSPPLPEENLFFNGRLVPIEPSSLLVTSSESNTKFPTKLLKSATKFRVLMAYKFKKSKENATQKVEGQNEQEKAAHESIQKEKEGQNRKFFTVKFIKVEEVPIVSLFTRDNSSKGENRNGHKGNVNKNDDKDEEDKKFTKDKMQKYLKKVKPLYVRVSKRYGEKLRFSGQLTSLTGGGSKTYTNVAAPPSSSTEVKGGEAVEAAEAPVNSSKNGSTSSLKILREKSLSTGLLVVRKHLGKSKSASLATARAAVATAQSVSKRRDDSLLQQQDGIQSAILHCKRSFNATRDVEASILVRSVSDPSAEVSCSQESKMG